MTTTDWDAIIVGQGLAGTTLAWALTHAGQRVLIIDSDPPVTSSKIAAGLITPITGMRLAMSPGLGEALPTAQTFYRNIETMTGHSFFHTRKAIRLFQSDLERQSFAERWQRSDFANCLVMPQPNPIIDADVADASGGGFQMLSAQLDVSTYLESTRARLPFLKSAIDWRRDIEIAPTATNVLGHSTRHLISCEGFAASRNPYFDWVPFSAAKGEIITIRFDRALLTNPIHRGIWLAPTIDPLTFRVGASYDLTTLDQTPTSAARADIVSQLKAFVRLPYQITDHHAAVRPIIHESKVRVGCHPNYPHLCYFNGLGSKGALLAPLFANALTQHLVCGQPLPVAHDVRRLAANETHN